MISIIMNCYLKIDLVKPTIEAILTNTYDYELILIDNHSPHQETRDYIRSIDAKIIDKGKNIGVGAGFNAGLKVAKSNYIAKVDDDTLVITPDWDTMMIGAIKEYETNYNQVAYFSINHGTVFQNENKYLIELPNYKVEIWKSVVNFPFVVIPRKTIELFGLFDEKYLYGGSEEITYYNKSVQHNMDIGYVMDVLGEHMGYAEYDIDYALWKVRYGFLGIRDASYEDIRNDPQKLYENAKLVIGCPVFDKIARKRIKELITHTALKPKPLSLL